MIKQIKILIKETLISLISIFKEKPIPNPYDSFIRNLEENSINKESIDFKKEFENYKRIMSKSNL
jgi:hypothetical protein